jgi:DNA repair protein RadA
MEKQVSNNNNSFFDEFAREPEEGFSHIARTKIDGVPKAVRPTISDTLCTANIYYKNRLKSVERISTGSNNLNKLLGGGVETKAVTEFYGESRSGKTQLCHTLCAIVPQNKSKGGIDGKSIYLDTEETFRPERIAEIAIARGFDVNVTLENIFPISVLNTTQQELILQNVIPFIKANNGEGSPKVKLLIVDSAVAHYRAEYVGRKNLVESHQKLYSFMHKLREIAQIYGIAVVVTNHVSTVPDSCVIDSDKPIGGNAMAHAITYGIHVRKRQYNPSILNATIVVSPYHPQNYTCFRISEKGIEDE